MSEAERIEAERLLAHVLSANTRWFKVSAWLIEFGLRNVPDGQSSRNPAKWVIAEVGCRMGDAQRKRVNRRLDAEFGTIKQSANGRPPDDKSTLPPRRLPATALFMLGSRADQPGWVSFLLRAKAEGFSLDQPGDHDLSDEGWREVAETRISALCMAFDHAANGRQP